MPTDRVVLIVPARGEFARTVRMTASEVVSRRGASYDDVDDVRMAADEAFVLACARLQPDSSLTFTFDIDEGTLVCVVGPMPCGDGGALEDEGGRYAEFILESVCDEFGCVVEGDVSYLRLVKRIG